MLLRCTLAYLAVATLAVLNRDEVHADNLEEESLEVAVAGA
ncbi:hypothetical protein [Methanoculleus methanifontis]|nr:hypothetical protein [Methanoculleus sp. FWC-SCC3]